MNNVPAINIPAINGPAMTQDQIRAYLERIGLDRFELEHAGLSDFAQLDLEFLSALQWKHMCAVPFENIDIMNDVPVTLDRETLFEKIVVRRRGGVCSELNTLYNWLLESLGFQVESFSSRVISDAVPYPGRSHRIMCVRLGDDRYITDVGYNYEHHRKPLLLQDGLLQTDGTCDYLLQRQAIYGWLMLQKPAGSQQPWRKKIAFSEDPNLDSDFVAATYFAQYHPDSKINKALKISRYEDGRFYAIRQGDFLTEDGGVVRTLEPGITDERTEELVQGFFFQTNLGESKCRAK